MSAAFDRMWVVACARLADRLRTQLAPVDARIAAASRHGGGSPAANDVDMAIGLRARLALAEGMAEILTVNEERSE